MVMKETVFAQQTPFLDVTGLSDVPGGSDTTYDLMSEHKFYIVRSIRLKIDHNLMVKPGSLYRVLKTFNDIGYNLIKLESRPIPETEFQFMFYFDFEASVCHKDYIDTLCALEEECETMEYLGSYSEKI